MPNTILDPISQVKMWKSKYECLEQLVDKVKENSTLFFLKDEKIFILIEIDV